MSLRQEVTERSAVRRSQATAGTQKDKEPPHRLYPSLPNTERCEGEEPGSSTSEMLPAAAARRPESLLGNTQSDTPDSSMKAHIVILEAQRRELLSINERWAKEYHTMVHYYREKGGSGDVSSELWKAESETLNRTLTRRGQHQQKEIQRLNKALEEALQNTQQLREGEDTQEESVWKHQAEVFKEDFMKERRDRERLKGKHLELERKLRKAQNELFILKSQMTCTCKHLDEHANREGHICAKACQNPRHHGQFEQHKPHS